METKVTVLTRVSVLHPIKVRFVTKFIAQQEEIAGLGNGDRPGQLRELIADEDFVPPQRSKLITCSMKAKIEPLKQAVICARQNVIIPTK